MNVRQLAAHLSSIKPELQDKPVKVLYPNGEIGIFDVKFILKDRGNMDKTAENVEYIFLTPQ